MVKKKRGKIRVRNFKKISPRRNLGYVKPINLSKMK
jgi:hypothetical protein